MKFSCAILPFAGLLLLQTATALPLTGTKVAVAKRDGGGVYYGSPKCGSAWSHCVYMDGSIYTPGPLEEYESAKCSALNEYGNGLDKCEFPIVAKAKIRCDTDYDDSYILVVFGESKSAFKVYGQGCKAYWSSKKYEWNRNAIAETFEAGDDLYVDWA